MIDVQAAQEALTRRYGPFTGWQWGALGGGTYGVYRYFHKKAAGAVISTPTGVATGAAYQSLGGVPGADVSSSNDSVLAGIASLASQLASMGTVQQPVQPINPTPGPTVNLSLLGINLGRMAQMPQFQSDSAQLQNWEQQVLDMSTGKTAYNDNLIHGISGYLISAGIPIDTLVNIGNPSNPTPPVSTPQQPVTTPPPSVAPPPYYSPPPVYNGPSNMGLVFDPQGQPGDNWVSPQELYKRIALRNAVSNGSLIYNAQTGAFTPTNPGLTVDMILSGITSVPAMANYNNNPVTIGTPYTGIPGGPVSATTIVYRGQPGTPVDLDGGAFQN